MRAFFPWFAYKFRVECYRVKHTNCSLGHTCSGTAAATLAAFGIGRDKILLTGENFGIALTAVENHPLVPQSSSAKYRSCLGFAESVRKSFGCDLETIGNINCIETAFERNGIHGNAGDFNFCAACSHDVHIICDRRRILRESYRQIVYAVTVGAAIEDPLNINAYCFFKAVIQFAHKKPPVNNI